MKQILSQLSVEQLLERALFIYNNTEPEGSRDGFFIREERTWRYFEDELESVLAGYFKDPTDSEFSQNLVDQGFTMTKEQAVESLIDMIIEVSSRFTINQMQFVNYEFFVDWAENHHFFVAELQSYIDQGNSTFTWKDESGNGAALNFGMDITNEFTVMFYGINFGEELEFIDTMEAFFKYKIAELS